MNFDRQQVFDPDYTVTKNGKPLDLVHAANEETGEATILCTDREGNPIKDDSALGYETIKVKGKIEITKIAKPEPTKSESESGGYGYDAHGFPYGCCGAVEETYHQVLVSESFRMKSVRRLFEVDPEDKSSRKKPHFMVQVNGWHFTSRYQVEKIEAEPDGLHLFLKADNPEKNVDLLIRPCSMLMDYGFPSASLGNGRYTTPPVDLSGRVVEGREEWTLEEAVPVVTFLNQWLLGVGT